MRTCKEDGCTAPAKSKGYCGRHYRQLWRYSHVLQEGIKNDTVTRENIISLKSEYKRVLDIYNNVNGVDSRIRWRKVLDKLVQEAKNINVDLTEE